jgi:hypothetical protein
MWAWMLPMSPMPGASVSSRNQSLQLGIKQWNSVFNLAVKKGAGGNHPSHPETVYHQDQGHQKERLGRIGLAVSTSPHNPNPRIIP